MRSHHGFTRNRFIVSLLLVVAVLIIGPGRDAGVQGFPASDAGGPEVARARRGSNKNFVNEWAVHVTGGVEAAKQVARELGYDYKGQVRQPFTHLLTHCINSFVKAFILVVYL